MARLDAGVGLDQQREDLAVDAVRDPGFGAVDHIILVTAADLIDGPPSRGADRLQVGPAIGLGKGEAAAQLAGREARQELILLRRRAEALDRSGHDQMRVEDAGQRHPHGGYGLDDLGVARRRQAEPAVIGADRGAEQAELLHAIDDVGGPDVVVFEGVDMRLDLAVEKAFDAVEDQPVLVGIRYRHGIHHRDTRARKISVSVFSVSLW